MKQSQFVLSRPMKTFFLSCFCRLAPIAHSALTTSTIPQRQPSQWHHKEHPLEALSRMVGFTGSYSHSAGDVFVFKAVSLAGVILPLTIGYGGMAGNTDTYTVDQTWYSGASYSYRSSTGSSHWGGVGLHNLRYGQKLPADQRSQGAKHRQARLTAQAPRSKSLTAVTLR